MDQPAHRHDHVLVIPRMHYPDLESLPDPVRNDLFAHVQKVAAVVRRKHGGCNILINDGKAAGQFVMHAHVHIIPRDKGDGIQIEKWRNVHISNRTFQQVSDAYEKALREMENKR